MALRHIIASKKTAVRIDDQYEEGQARTGYVVVGYLLVDMLEVSQKLSQARGVKTDEVQPLVVLTSQCLTASAGIGRS